MLRKLYKCRYPMLMAFATAPAVLITGALRADDPPQLWLLFVLLYALLGCLCMFLPGKLRLIAGLAGCALIASAGWHFLPWREDWVLWVIPLFHIILLLFTLPMGGWERGQELNPAWPICGIGIHLIVQFLIHIQQSGRRSAVFDALKTPALLCFLVFLIFCLMMLNRVSLMGAMPDSAAVPLSIRRRNRWLVWLMLGAALLLSLIPAFARWLNALWITVRDALVALIRWLTSLGWQRGGEVASGGAMPPDMMGMEAGEASLLARIMEKVMIVVAIALAVLIAAWALRFLWKKLKILFNWLMQRLRSYAQSASEDYVDELEDTRTQGEERFSFARELFRKRLTERDLKDLPPREQIRKRYGILRRRHPEWADSQTVRDTLNETPASLYERARYSSHEISAADADAFKPTGKEQRR